VLLSAISSSAAADKLSNPLDPHAKKQRGKSTIIWLCALLLAALAGLIFLWWFFIARFSESTDDAYLQADSVTLAPKVSGYISEVLIKDNQRVNPGQPLVRLNDQQYQARVNEMRATADANQAAIDRAQAEIARQQAEIEQAQARQQGAQVQLSYAEHEYQRYLPLAASGAEAQEHVAQLRRSRDQAQADFNGNVAALKAASAQIKTLHAQIVQGNAQLASSHASLQQSDIDLHDTLISSPIAGVVGDKTVRVGQYVQPGTRLLTVVPLQDIYLVANFKETQMARIRVGQPALLHVDAQPGEIFHGVVDSFAPGTGSQFALLPPENASGNFTKIVQRIPVKIRLTDSTTARQPLLPGMSVTVDIDTHHLQVEPRS
jgi:membrane fusion protein (multidrug efflux system)